MRWTQEGNDAHGDCLVRNKVAPSGIFSEDLFLTICVELVD
jgi:hypothetical protein